MALMAKCKDKTCFAYYKGNCRCLSNNNFHGKRCPFRRDDLTWEEQLFDCEEYGKKGASK